MARYHPRVAKIYDSGEKLISGSSMRFFLDVAFNDGMDQFRLSPD
jgi:hypothetical protein